MIYLINNETPFPSPDTASEEGIVAFGGNLNPARLVEAYSQGIFPWYNEGDPVLVVSRPSLCAFPRKTAYWQKYAQTPPQSSLSRYLQPLFYPSDAAMRYSAPQRPTRHLDSPRTYRSLYNPSSARNCTLGRGMARRNPCRGLIRTSNR